MARLPGHEGYPFLNKGQKEFMIALRDVDKRTDGGKMTPYDHSRNEITNIVNAVDYVITTDEAIQGLRRIK